MTIAERIQYTISVLLQSSLVVAIAYSLWRGHWHILFLSTLSYLVTLLPAFISRNVRIHLPIEFELSLIAFVYAATFLGEAAAFYTRFWWWDILLHTLSGIIFGFAGFLVLFTFYASRRLIAAPYIIAISTAVFGLAIGAVWEIFEFVVDQLTNANMQEGGLPDTMWDLINDLLGSLLIAHLGYLYIRRHKTSRGFFSMLIQKFIDRNPELVRLIDRYK